MTDKEKENFDWDEFAKGVAPTIDIDTMAGDIRDVFLAQFRGIKVPWAHLNEREQGDVIAKTRNTAQDMIRRIMHGIAEKGFPHVPVIIKKVEFSDGLKIALTGAETVPNITALAEHGKMGAVLVLCEASSYFGEKSEAKPDADQPDLPLNKNEPRKPPKIEDEDGEDKE